MRGRGLVMLLFWRRDGQLSPWGFVPAQFYSFIFLQRNGNKKGDYIGLHPPTIIGLYITQTLLTYSFSTMWGKMESF